MVGNTEAQFDVDGDQKALHRSLAPEHGNVRVALAWSTTSEARAASGVRLALAFTRFWKTQGLSKQGRDWFSRLFAVAKPRELGALGGKALCTAAELARFLSDYDAAEAWTSESASIQRELGNRSGVAAALRSRATLSFARDDFETDIALQRESLVICRELGEVAVVAKSLNNIGIASVWLRQFEAARASFAESLATRRAMGRTGDDQMTLNNLGMLAYAEGDYPRARQRFQQCIDVERETGTQRSLSYGLNNLGMVAIEEGDSETALSLCREGLIIRRQQGDIWATPWSLEAIADAHAPTEPLKSARLWGQAAILREEIRSALPRLLVPARERRIAAARAAVGDSAAFDRAWEEGRAMTLDAAIDYALQL